jgi:hypothetical protein
MARNAQAGRTVRIPSSARCNPVFVSSVPRCSVLVVALMRSATSLCPAVTQTNHCVYCRYSPNSEDSFPNVVKDVKKSISYVQMGADQAWNRCHVLSLVKFISAASYHLM